MFPVLDEAVLEIKQALAAVYEYRKKARTTSIKLESGKLTSKKNGLYIYDFPYQGTVYDIEQQLIIFRLDDGNRIEIEGELLSVTEETIRFAFINDFGETFGPIELVFADFLLIKKLLDKFNNLNDSHNKDLAEALLTNKFSELKPIKFVKDNQLNEYQTQALQSSSSINTSYIWGPPGTGKTKTIGCIVKALRSSDKKVLLLSHTNIATDGILWELIKNKSEQEYINENLGEIIRIGMIHKPELKNLEALISPDLIEAELIRRVEEEIKEIESNITNLKKFSNTFKNTPEGKYHALTQKISTFKKDIDALNQTAEKLRSKFSKIDSDLNNIESKLDKYTKNKKSLIGRIKNTFSQNDLKLNEHKNEILNKLKVIASEHNNTVDIQDKKEAELIELERQLQKASELIDFNKLNAALCDLGNQEEKINALAEAVLITQEKIKNIPGSIIKNAKIVATTLTKAYLHKEINPDIFDVVIVDEASMAQIPSLIYSALISSSQLIIVGDPFQLPPVNDYVNQGNATDSLVGKWMSNSIYDITGIYKEILNGNLPANVVQLRMQYRMDKDIAKLDNHLIYNRYADGKFNLISIDNIKNEKPISIVDISSKGTIPLLTRGSFYNIYSALLSVDLAKKALAKGFNSIGIITPFRPQANLIQKILIDNNLTSKIQADTVHRFQGGEKDVIIFDIVTSTRTKLTNSDEKGGDPEKILNVAISRSKNNFVFIGDLKGIKERHSKSSLYIKMIEYIEKNNYPIYRDYQIEQELIITPEKEKRSVDVKGQFYSNEDFDKFFLKDLLRAKKEILIFSPFLTQKRIEVFLKTFKTLVNKGVMIFVFYQPNAVNNDNQMKTLLSQMNTVGVKSIPIFRIHSKLAFIDRKILWEGSLNILSFTGLTVEHMHRIDGIKTITELVKRLDINYNIGNIGESHLKKCTKCGNYFWIKNIKGRNYYECGGCGWKFIGRY